jgi:hypothetical protein
LRPILSLSFNVPEMTGGRAQTSGNLFEPDALPPFFSNLLPEGVLRIHGQTPEDP